MKKSLLKHQKRTEEKLSFFQKILMIWNRQFNTQWFLAKQKADNYLAKRGK